MPAAARSIRNISASLRSRPGTRPERLAGGLAVQVAAQQLRQVQRELLDLCLAALVLPGRQGDGWRVRVEVERLRRQAGRSGYTKVRKLTKRHRAGLPVAPASVLTGRWRK